MNICFDQLRGQYYDGASAISRSKNGVAKYISDIEPKALFAHCYGHALNLAASDTVKTIEDSNECTELSTGDS